MSPMKPPDRHLLSWSLSRFTDKKVSCFKWDSRHLPLRDSTIDIIISDIPFGMTCSSLLLKPRITSAFAGQRHGSHPANRKLYPLIFKEFRRVLRLGGRVILLTTEVWALSLLSLWPYLMRILRSVLS
jgi:tRNA G10  N-methylase Trm11